jgi:hypothetical protein
MVVERPIGGPVVILAVVVVQARHPERPASGPSRCGARVAAGARIGGGTTSCQRGTTGGDSGGTGAASGGAGGWPTSEERPRRRPEPMRS